jgi:translation initiation factor eIF-2B subunit gamma
MEIRSDLMDAHLYAFKRLVHIVLTFFDGLFDRSLHSAIDHSIITAGCRTILQDVLEQKESYCSIRLEVLPYLVRSQLVCLC